jgi:cobalt/nickel transport system permease protein
MRLIDASAHANRWRARHPAEKLALALGLILAVLATPPLVSAPLALLVALLATTLGAGVAWGAVLTLMLVPAGFVALSLPGLVLSLEMEPALRLVPAPGGGRLALDVGLRAIAAASALSMLVLTTPLPDLLRLARRAGVPAAVVEVAGLTYRFIFLLADTAAGVRRAQAARLGDGRLPARLRATGLLAAQLLPVALDRARRLDRGLAARGGLGELAVLADTAPASPSALACAVAVPAAITLVAQLAG